MSHHLAFAVAFLRLSQTSTSSSNAASSKPDPTELLLISWRPVDCLPPCIATRRRHRRRSRCVVSRRRIVDALPWDDDDTFYYPLGPAARVGGAREKTRVKERTSTSVNECRQCKRRRSLNTRLPNTLSRPRQFPLPSRELFTLHEDAAASIFNVFNDTMRGVSRTFPRCTYGGHTRHELSLHARHATLRSLQRMHVHNVKTRDRIPTPRRNEHTLGCQRSTFTSFASPPPPLPSDRSDPIRSVDCRSCSSPFVSAAIRSDKSFVYTCANYIIDHVINFNILVKW